MAFFEARNLHKRFGSRVVLENISLAFDRGQVSGIMGPNGAGKTTCFHVLTGLHQPDLIIIAVEISQKLPCFFWMLGFRICACP